MQRMKTHTEKVGPVPERMAQNVTRHLEVREGFPEEVATYDPDLKRQKWHWALCRVRTSPLY